MGLLWNTPNTAKDDDDRGGVREATSEGHAQKQEKNPTPLSFKKKIESSSKLGFEVLPLIS